MSFPEVETIPARFNKTKWNAQIVPLLNELRARVLTQGFTYIVQMEDNVCQAVHKRKVVKDGDATEVFQWLLDNAPNGSAVKVNNGGYELDAKLTIPKGKKNIWFTGDGWLGKDAAEGGGLNGTHIKTSAQTLMDNTYDDNVRSVFGLMFTNLKFEGPKGASSKGFDTVNTDAFMFDHCTFFNFGTALESRFVGDSVPEQPGLGPITNCLFAQGDKQYIKFAQNTQVYIAHNIFQSFGDFTNAIEGIDSDKVQIVDNEFNTTNNKDNFTEYIKVTHDNAGFGSSGWRIFGNWAYLEQANFRWLTLNGSQTIPSIVSKNNTLFHGYTPNLKTGLGPYALADVTKHAVQASDFIMPPCNDPIVDMSDYSAGTVWQNKWTPLTLHFKFNVPHPDYVNLQLGRTPSTMWTVNTVQCLSGSGTGGLFTATLRVPTMFHWRIVTSGDATQDSVVGVFDV
jgi:hypothetical protein